jgi:hypothetical protein
MGWRGPLVAFGTAAAIIFVAVATALLIRGPQSSDPATPPVQPTVTTVASTSTVLEETGPEAAFSWDGDDLSEWLTEAEMAQALEDGLRSHENAELDPRILVDGSVDVGSWTWSFGAAAGKEGPWELSVHNGDHDGSYVGPPPETDSKLPQGVTFEREEGFGWGHYIFSGPNSDEMTSVWLRPPATSFGYPAGSETEVHEAVLFPLASWMLQEMGWVDPLEDALPPAGSEPDPVPIMEMEQVLYGAGDLGCPEHWAHDQSLPVGSVEFQTGQGMFTVVVELTAAAPNSRYGVEVWEPETCRYRGPLLFEAPVPRVLTTDETGAGRIEFPVEEVDAGTYRLNVNVVRNVWGDTFPDAEDTRLREIGGAGFSLVEVR